MAKIICLLIVIACIMLAVTNPGETAHKEIVYNRLSNEVGMQGLIGEFAGGMLGNLNMLPMKYNNYFLFSTMTFRDELVSIGCFRYVRATDWDASAENLRVTSMPGRPASR
jgi:hypothetical protein